MLELSIVLLIIALIAGSGIIAGKTAKDSAQSATTNTRLDVLETALMAFRMSGNRLPCPADGTLTESSANFGKEASTLGNCKDGVSPIQANYVASVGSSTIVEGVVPVRTLNLPDDFMYDGWGRKITYAVWAPMTSMRAFFNYGVMFNCGLLSLTDAAGAIRSSQTAYVLLSYGANGHGAFTANGTKLNADSTNAYEHINCHCHNDATDQGYTGNYVLKDATVDSTSTLDNFDDVLRYKERWQMQNYNDQNNPAGGLTCPQGLPGFRVDGISPSDVSGSAVAVGDVNGDGIPDLIIGAPGVASGTGSVYVVFGTKTGFPDPLPLNSLNGINGFHIDGDGIDSGGNAGFSVAVGDVNGDGIADLIIGAPYAYGGNGSVFVVFGQHTWPAKSNFSTLNGANGFRLDNNGNLATNSGWSVAAGDINNDGYADIVIGTPVYNGTPGSVYVVFGAASFANPEYTLDDDPSTGILDDAATLGFTILPVDTNDSLGSAVAVGDTNGDGIADAVMGQNTYSSKIGMVSDVFGKGVGSWYTPLPAINLNGINGWHAFGINSGDVFGTSVAVGDVNGDGIGDIIIGAPNASPGGQTGAGITYVLFGSNAPRPRELYMTNLNGSNGFELDGLTVGDASGTSVAVGDINGDGIGDIIIGAPNAADTAGSTYVVFGSAAPIKADYPVNVAIKVRGGFELDGANAGDFSGTAVAAGDVNGDGRADVVIGAPNASPNGVSNAGSTYVYFGENTNSWPNPYNLGGL